MPVYVALLRAVNVGGTGKLASADLRALCHKAGFAAVRTYIASGNVVFHSDKTEAQVKAALQKHVAAHAGKPVGIMVRTAAEIAGVVARNPFAKAPPERVAVLFTDVLPLLGAREKITGRGNEEVKAGRREIYIFYPDGMGRSKLRIPAAENGTARNMNTVTRLADMAAEGD